MSPGGDTLVGARPVLVLYADISGSTSLFEQHGDTIARDACAACIEVLRGVVEQHRGRVVKTIGDEVMVVFEEPAEGVMAGTDMQGAVRQASADGRFVTGELRIKVGMHFGLALEEVDDLLGEAPIVAQQVIKLAKADQVLVTTETLQVVPPMLRAGSRFMDRVSSAATGATMDVYELIWEISGLTQVADVALKDPRAEHTRLLLSHEGNDFECNAERPVIAIGRVADNDIVVQTDLTSRHHAEIEYRRGRFHLADSSANGTLLIAEDGTTTSVRRESVALRGRGRLCMGGTPDRNPRGVVEFSCE